MEQYVIKGGNPLVGEVEIGGAKNAALGILAAAIMTDETVIIENLPNVRDINVLLSAMEGIGAKIERLGEHKVKINGSLIHDLSVDYEYINKIRASYYLLGALLGKYMRLKRVCTHWRSVTGRIFSADFPCTVVYTSMERCRLKRRRRLRFRMPLVGQCVCRVGEKPRISSI